MLVPCALELAAPVGRDVGQRCPLTQLERAHVEGDRPAVGDRDLLGVVRHDAEAARHDVEEVAVRLVAQPLLVKRRRLAVAALHDHPLAGADAVMARRAEDVVALVAARQDRRRDGDRGLPHQLTVRPAREVGKLAERLAAGDGAVDQWARAAAVGEEGARRERQDLRLVVHVLPAAAGDRNARGQRRHERSTSHQWSTSETWRGTSRSRKRRVSSRSKSGSSASMQRKKRSRLESAKRGTLNTGWYGMGSPFSASSPRTVTSAAPSTVHSKVIGMNDGQLLNGRPPTLIGKSITDVQ